MSGCLLGSMRQIVHLGDQYIARRLKEENLPILSAHIPLFYILPQNGDGLLFNELCEKWSKSKSSLSDIITKYVNSGLIKRCECQEDKRNVYIAMTPEAQEIKRVLDEICGEINEIVFGQTPVEDVDTFMKIIENMLIRGKEVL